MKSFLGKFALGILVGGALLYFAFQKIDAEHFFSYIKSARHIYLLPAVFVYMLTFIFKALRSGVLIRPLKPIGIRRVFPLFMMGPLMNNILPFRLGELARANITGQKIAASRSGILATIVAERLFDSLVYILLFFLTISFLPFPPWARTVFASGAVMVVLVFGILFVLSRYSHLATRVFSVQWLPSKVSTFLARLTTNFVSGLKVFTSLREIAVVFLFSLLAWTLEALVYLVIAASFSLPVNLIQCIFILILIGAGAALPTAPGFVGTVEFMGVLALSLIGIEKNASLAFVVTVHALQILTILVLGIGSIIVEKNLIF